MLIKPPPHTLSVIRHGDIKARTGITRIPPRHPDVQSGADTPSRVFEIFELGLRGDTSSTHQISDVSGRKRGWHFPRVGGTTGRALQIDFHGKFFRGVLRPSDERERGESLFGCQGATKTEEKLGQSYALSSHGEQVRQLRISGSRMPAEGHLRNFGAFPET